jgi:hypothetical protein
MAKDVDTGLAERRPSEGLLLNVQGEAPDDATEMDCTEAPAVVISLKTNAEGLALVADVVITSTTAIFPIVRAVWA